MSEQSFQQWLIFVFRTEKKANELGNFLQETCVVSLVGLTEGEYMLNIL